MTEPTTTPPAEGEQQSTAATPPATPAATPDPAPAGQEQTVDWEARYKGLMTVLNQKTADLDKAKSEAGTAAATIEQLTSETNTLRAEYDTKIAALGEQLTALTGERDDALTAKVELDSYKTKMEALKEYPLLLPLADTIPAIPDADTMKQHLDLMMKGVDKITTEKAELLTAGMTPGATPQTQPQYNFSTTEEWQSAMNNAAGGDEFAKISTAFKTWAEKQQ